MFHEIVYFPQPVLPPLSFDIALIVLDVHNLIIQAQDSI